MTDITCPACGAEFDLAVVFQAEEDRAAFDRLSANATPLKARAMHYVALFRTPGKRLSGAKRLKLLLQLLPDLERQAITWKGRDWPAPLAAWAQAVDQMLARRDAGTLELPLKGHGYLYAVLAGMADKHEAAQEQQREQHARSGPRAAHQRGAALSVADVVPGLVPLQPHPAAPLKDPALAAIEQRNRAATPMPAAVRERLAQIKKGT